MQLLPIIVVVSLLAFFVSLTIVICAYQSFRAQERKKGREGLGNKEGPVRQLTLRNGKVIPLTDEFKDLTTLQNGDSDISGNGALGYIPRSPRYKLFGCRDSGVPNDLEAQNHSQNQDPQKWEEDMRNIQRFNKQLVESSHFLNSRPLGSRKERARNRPKEVNSRRITESLRKAYDVPTVRSRDMSEVPLSPKSKPNTTRASSRQRQNSHRPDFSPKRRISKAKSEGNQPRQVSGKGERKDTGTAVQGSDRKASGKSFSLPPLPIKSVHAAKVPEPTTSVEIRSSKGRIGSMDKQKAEASSSRDAAKMPDSRAVSWSSKRTSHPSQKSRRHSQKSTTLSHHAPPPPLPTVKSPAPPVPPPPSQIWKAPTPVQQILNNPTAPSNTPRKPHPMTHVSSLPLTSSQTLKGPLPNEPKVFKTATYGPSIPELPKPIKVSPIKIQFSEDTEAELSNRQHRPPDIDTTIANSKHRSSFLLDGNTPPASPLRPAKAAPPDISTRSSHSVQTFASSDLSSAWTFGNAQRVAIFPSVAPRALAVGSTNITPLRPRSKYGRPVGKRRQKALPVLPKSPLSQE
ncbi:MAG: hypothetical protein Q9190_006848 [Brigantiaea leucoxantha]